MPGSWIALIVLAAADVPSPTFDAYQRDEAIPVGRLVRLGTDWSATLAADGTVTIAGDDLVELRRRDRASPPWPRRPQIRFANGDRVPGRVVGGGGNSLRFRPDASPDVEWAVPLSQLAEIWSAAPTLVAEGNPGWRDWVVTGRKRDALLLSNGDFLTGTLTESGGPDRPLRFRTESGSAVEVPAAQVAALGFSTALTRTRRPADPYARVTLADGTRLALRAAECDGETLAGETFFRARFRAPVAELIALRMHNGPAVYLSELEPAAVEARAYFREPGFWRNGRAADGGPIRLVGPDRRIDTHDDGIGTRPAVGLRYEPAGEFRRFEAWVGLRPRADPEDRIGSARLTVDPDGPAPQAELTLTAGRPARFWRVDTAGAGRLSLGVNFGPTGHVQDDVNWAMARLIR